MKIEIDLETIKYWLECISDGKGVYVKKALRGILKKWGSNE